ncbi:MAG: aminomethyl-transferring glycine dehydrogenase subunit GcvPA [Ardenticatenaceae bacterium]|nr:aminomethyl-transferring glycine dehydrogenase subunit GcvPA [Ardenticatenaceae bacterium]
MRYTPHTEADRRAMLDAIGVERVEDLFADVPANLRFPSLDLPKGLSEPEVWQYFSRMAAKNAALNEHACFLGAGAYYHYVPAALPHLLFRSEFYTAYTPYQPEISQGTLQTIFEFQTLVCQLTGMEVANASMYDGSTAFAESALTAARLGRGRRPRLLVSAAIHPEYRAVLETYTHGQDLEIVTIDYDPATGLTDQASIQAQLDQRTAAVMVQYPNFFGQIEPLGELADAVHRAGGLLTVSADPVALALLKTPGELGADIVTGEGQPLGLLPMFGGPYLGLFATLERHVRQMPGRLAGETVDSEGRRAYVLTLQAREQHIRREKATSNICTNEALAATAATIYLSLLGKSGFTQVATLCYQRAHYLADQLARLDGYDLAFSAPFMREFVIRTPRPVAELNRTLWEEHGIIGGYDLGRAYPELQNHWLLTTTEMNSREQIDRFVGALRENAEEKVLVAEC